MENNVDRIKAGKQLGITFFFKNQNNEVIWSSVAVQKWKDMYKIYIDEILESKMNMEDYLLEITKEVDTIDDVIEFISLNSKTTFEFLKPCRGQKIFNPSLNIT